MQKIRESYLILAFKGRLDPARSTPALHHAS